MFTNSHHYLIHSTRYFVFMKIFTRRTSSGINLVEGPFPKTKVHDRTCMTGGMSLTSPLWLPVGTLQRWACKAQRSLNYQCLSKLDLPKLNLTWKKPLNYRGTPGWVSYPARLGPFGSRNRTPDSRHGVGAETLQRSSHDSS